MYHTAMKDLRPAKPYVKAATTPAAAAKRVAALLAWHFGAKVINGRGYGGINIHNPERDGEWGYDYGAPWSVYWEEGPYDWAVELLGWTDIYEALNLDPDKVFAEPATGFALGFYKADW